MLSQRQIPSGGKATGMSLVSWSSPSPGVDDVVMEVRTLDLFAHGKHSSAGLPRNLQDHIMASCTLFVPGQISMHATEL